MNTSAFERWLPVAGYDGFYEVSDQGRVRSLSRKVQNAGKVDYISGRILSPNFTGKGYLFVNLCRNGDRTMAYVHRLVATAFLPPSEAPHVNHIDSVKTNNAASNLEWVTPKQNTHHAIAAGKFAIAHMNGRTLAINNPARAKKLSAAEVASIRSACAAGEPQASIGARFGITQATVSKIKRGAVWNTQPRIRHITAVAQQAKAA
jgi:hypothetical protein